MEEKTVNLLGNPILWYGAAGRGARVSRKMEIQVPTAITLHRERSSDLVF
jgi:hypothetical protein